MYRYYNANPRNNSVTDCFIRSLSVALDLPWDAVYSKISDIAQWEGTTMDNRDFVLEYLDRNFLRQPKFYGTIGEASRFYKDNIVLITTRGHIVASKYGQVIDTWDSTKRKVEFIWIVE